MNRHLESLRSKPNHVKRGIAFFTSVGITVVIFVFWVTSFSIQNQSDGALAVSNGGVKIASPMASLTASAGDAWNTLKTYFVFDGAQKVNSNPIEISAGSR
jgi:hypothetical protein